MKNLIEAINEELIVEAAAKNVHMPRKGSTIYVLKKGESKAVPLKVTNVRKLKNAWYGKNSGGYDIVIELEDKAFELFEINGWTQPHYGYGFDYSDEKYQVKEFTYTGKDSKVSSYYAGVSKEAIQSFISSITSKKLKGLMKEIENKQKELDELMQEKQKLEMDINIKITESLK